MGRHISDFEAMETPEQAAAHFLKIRQTGTDLFGNPTPRKGRDHLARRGQCGFLAQRRGTDTGLQPRHHRASKRRKCFGNGSTCRISSPRSLRQCPAGSTIPNSAGRQ